MAQQASARHLLVNSKAKCQQIKAKIVAGANFAEMARQYSRCPSARRGGELGQFSRGMMVAEFDRVVFSAPLFTLQGPIKTQFGYHLIEVTYRQSEHDFNHQ